MTSLDQRQAELAELVRVTARETGWDFQDVLHQVHGRNADKAAVARVLCPDAEAEWTGNWEQRQAARDAHAERAHKHMQDRVLSAAAALDPADQSPEARHVREVAASVRDHRADAERRAAWAAQDRGRAEEATARAAFADRDRLQAESQAAAAAGDRTTAGLKAIEMRRADQRGNAATHRSIEHGNTAKAHDQAACEWLAANTAADRQTAANTAADRQTADNSRQRTDDACDEF